MNARSTVHSIDGTPIAVWREGSGPPLLLVHGGLCDHLAWYFVTPLLGRRFTVWSFDRRGHGRSGETLPYTVERELEDIAAVLSQIGEPAHLLGHSAGAILGLAAALRTNALRSLILYEPAFIVNDARPRPSPELLEEMKRLLAAGDPDGALRIAMRETVSLPDAEIDRMQAGPGWEHLRDAARAIPNDWKLWDEPLVPERFRDLQTRVLLMRGTESPTWLRTGTEAIRDALPNATLVGLNGQSHSAMFTAPQDFAEKVVEFACGLDPNPRSYAMDSADRD